MANTSPEEAYALYRRVAQEPLLSVTEFHEFWLILSSAEQAWWLKDFSTGKTKLSKKLLDFNSVFDKVQRGETDPTLFAAIDAVVQAEQPTTGSVF